MIILISTYFTHSYKKYTTLLGLWDRLVHKIEKKKKPYVTNEI